jgi:hypothetical protein
MIEEGVAIWDVPWMEETFSDEDSDDELESSDEEEESKDKVEKQKVDRLNSLKPFTDLEQYTLKVSDMQSEYKKKLSAINEGQSDDTSLEVRVRPVNRWDMNHNEFIAFDGSSKKPVERTEPKSDKPSEPNDEVFDWLTEPLHASSYFCIVNTNRKPVMPGE